MIYTEKTRLAAEFAIEHHAGQKDKSGFPYMFHFFTVAQKMTDEVSCCAALLHDTVEDTSATFEEIESLFGKEVCDVVRLLTRPEDEEYFDYVQKISKNRTATLVKLSDLEHNSDLSRLPTVGPKDIKRTEKYKKAREILLSAIAEQDNA